MEEAFKAQNCADDVFAQLERGRLSEFARGEWEFHKRVIDATMAGGWDNPQHPWLRSMQDFWRYPLAFSTYAIPSLVMVEEGLFTEAAEYMRKSILLFKDTPIWDGWVRKGQGPDPICCKNIMYKGHLNLMLGLYQLMTGSQEFETQFQQVSHIILSEYDYNATYRGFWGIECEDDQYFPPCNSQGILSVLVYDRVYGTDYYERFAAKVAAFIRDKVSDPRTHIPFVKYHPSHDQAEAYLSGAFSAWTLTQTHVTDPAFNERAFANFKDLFVEHAAPDEIYLKECSFSIEPAMGLEESLGILYVPGMGREYGDKALWAESTQYLASRDGLAWIDGLPRLTNVTPEEETYIQCYHLWGALHNGWDRLLNYDWEVVARRNGGN